MVKTNDNGNEIKNFIDNCENKSENNFEHCEPQTVKTSNENCKQTFQSKENFCDSTPVINSKDENNKSEFDYYVTSVDTDDSPQMGKTMCLWGQISDKVCNISFLLDCGATISLLSKQCYDELPESEKPELKPNVKTIGASNGGKIKHYGTATFNLEFQGLKFTERFWVCDSVQMGILGTDFMHRNQVTLDWGRYKCFVGKKQIKVHDISKVPMYSKVVAATTVKIPAGKEMIIPGKVYADSEMRSAIGVLDPAMCTYRKCGALVARIIVDTRQATVPIRVLNPCEEEDIIIHENATLGKIDAVAELQPLDIDDKNQKQTESDLPIVVPEHLTDLYNRSTKDLPDHECIAVAQLLAKFANTFAKNSNDLGKTDVVKHHIDTGDEPPVRQRARRLPITQTEELKRQIDELHKNGIIRESDSNYSSNVLLVKKKDNSWRLCVDYRELNSKTKNTDTYMLPRIDDTLEALAGAKYYCTLDLLQSYHQVLMTDESKAKTAFLTPRITPNHWEYNYMPFGVTGGPATFQRLIDKILRGLEYKIALAYLDDIVVYGSSVTQCISRLETVFGRLQDANLKLKPKKCVLFQEQILYLGHIVSADGISCDPDKISAVAKWRAPRTLRQLRTFLGTVGYYKRFIKGYADICKPLYTLTKKNEPFVWNDEREVAFQTLKERLITAPVMAYPSETGQYVLDTDASGFAIGGVLSIVKTNDKGEPEEKVISYASRVLQDRETRYCTRRRELLAIVDFVKHFRPYLFGRKFIIRTDHASLRYIKTLKEPDHQLGRWIVALEEFNYTIQIRKGVLHNNADGLSRYDCEGKRCICTEVNQLECMCDKLNENLLKNSPNFQQISLESTSVDTSQKSACDQTADLSKSKVYENVVNLTSKQKQNNNNETADPSNLYEHFVNTESKQTAREEKEKSTTNETEPMVNAIRFNQLWTNEQMSVAQQTDPDLALIYQYKAENKPKPDRKEMSASSLAAKAYWGEWERIELNNDILYRRWESDDGSLIVKQLLLPHEYQPIVLRHLHDDRTSAHLGRKRTIAKVQQRFHWYKLRDYISRYIRSCDVCQRRKRPGLTPRAPLQKYVIGYPMERVCIDLSGPLRITPRGNRYIMVICDYFTKWSQAIAIPNKEAKTVAEAYVTQWYSLWTGSTFLMSDQGSEFESQLFTEVCKLLQIEKNRTTAYHPQSDGLVERQNSTIGTMLHALTEDFDDWDLMLPFAMMAYRATVHDSTGETPNFLMTGRQAMIPLDIMTDRDLEIDSIPTTAYAQRLEEDLRTCYTRVRKNLDKAATRQKQYYDRKSHLNKYHRGDLVMMKTMIHQPGTGKLEDKYLGPYAVLDALSSVNFRIQMNPNKRPIIVHHDRLKPYYARNPEENDTSWIYDLPGYQKPANTNRINVPCIPTVPTENENVPELQNIFEENETEIEPIPNVTTDRTKTENIIQQCASDTKTVKPKMIIECDNLIQNKSNKAKPKTRLQDSEQDIINNCDLNTEQLTDSETVIKRVPVVTRRSTRNKSRKTPKRH